MRVWIDCEFNEFRGDLISMALVAEDDSEWYEVLPCHDPGPWVKQHVIPYLGRKPITPHDFQRSLQAWLNKFSAITLTADWPEDIAHFCQWLITAPGMKLKTPPLVFQLFEGLDSVQPAIPHNALSDARAIKASHLKMTDSP